MTPEDLSRRHPSLFHVTPAGAAQSILKHGLLATKDILDRWEVPGAERSDLRTRRRRAPVTREHPVHGEITLNNNAPLSELKLAKVLDDDLTQGQWLEMLNSRVFFFVSGTQLRSLTEARANKHSTKDILEIHTRRLAEAYGPEMEIAPINSGNTNYDAVRRGHANFAPLLSTDYESWRRRRGKVSPDLIKEVAVRGSIPDIADFVANVREGVRPS